MEPHGQALYRYGAGQARGPSVSSAESAEAYPPTRKASTGYRAFKHRHRLVARERHNDTNAHPHLPHIGDRRCRKSWKESPLVNRDKTTQRDLRFGGSKTI